MSRIKDVLKALDDDIERKQLQKWTPYKSGEIKGLEHARWLLKLSTRHLHMAYPIMFPKNTVTNALTKDELILLHSFVGNVVLNTKFTEQEFDISRSSWAYGGRGWLKYNMGETWICYCVAWYHHRYKPGSHEGSPGIIMKAVLEEAVKWDGIETVLLNA